MKTILLVDDESLIRVETEKILLQTGQYHIFTAKNGRDALEIFKKQDGAFNLILVDLKMPILNGLQFLEEIKKYCKGKIASQILVISAFHTEFEQKLKDICKYSFLEKPFGILELLNCVEKVLE